MTQHAHNRAEADSFAPAAASKADLRRLFVLRNLAILGQLATVTTVVVVLKIALPVTELLSIILALAVFNTVTWLRRRNHWQVSHAVFFTQLVVDVLGLTALLYFAGGATNPFVSLYLIPLTISATVLTSRSTWGLALITIACYTVLMRSYVPLPHMHMDMSQFGMHVFGMWLGFVLSAGVIAYFVVAMGKTLRQQDHALAAARERSLRDAQLVELGTLAASTAHELGTPLGTMALITAELTEEYGERDPLLHERLAALHTQIERCKAALSTLAVSSGGVRLAGGGPMAVDGYLKRLHADWQQANPGVTLQTNWVGEQPAPSILVDRTLSQAINNILDNAAEASPLAVEWHARWYPGEFVMEIRDRGPGLSAEARQHIGKVPYTGKAEGLGLGLFLAHAIIARFGGSVTLMDREGGGACTRVLLPCTQLTGITP
jgi:two-component system sensor histidine kinase RegB